MSKTTTADEVLNFWFKECTPEQWYKKDADFDVLLFRRFETTVSSALRGEMEAWQTDLNGCLAVILMLDQFTRNIFRNTPKAFSGDGKALKLSLACNDKGYLEHDNHTYRQFMLMPMMHSEYIAIQDQSLPLFKEFTSERAWGPDGYLVDKGMIPLPDDMRAKMAKQAQSLKSMTGKEL